MSTVLWKKPSECAYRVWRKRVWVVGVCVRDGDCTAVCEVGIGVSFIWRGRLQGSDRL